MFSHDFDDAHTQKSTVCRSAGDVVCANDIGDPRLIPHVQLHEFEAMLLANPNAFDCFFPANKKGIQLLAIDIGQREPETINDGQHTAPSKRIERCFPGYTNEKPRAGPTIAAAIGLPAIRAKCPHFDAWLATLEALGAA